MSGKNTKPILYIAQISSGVHVSGRKPWSKLQKQYHQFFAIVNHGGRDVPGGTSVQVQSCDAGETCREARLYWAFSGENTGRISN